MTPCSIKLQSKLMGYNRNLDRQKQAIQDEQDRRAGRRTSAERSAFWNGLGLGVVATVLAAGLFLFLTGRKPPANTPLAIGDVITSIYWSDGDSGEANGHPFRLNNGDAPETGGVGAAIGGAKCETEREWGFRAKEFMVLETKDGRQVVTGNYGQDRHGRWVLDIADDGRDLVELGMRSDVIRSWRHDGKKALEPRPDWCGGN